MTLNDFAPLLAASQATEAFRADLEAYAARRAADRITSGGSSPRVKVMRAIAQLLHSEPALTVDHVQVRGASGCADFVGVMEVTDAAGEVQTFDFAWNCEWKAKQLGYLDGFGFPDQIRAANEFGWQCFERWSRTIPAAHGA